MSKLEQIKEKMKARTGLQKEVDAFINAVEKTASDRVAKSASSKVIESINSLITEIKDYIANSNTVENSLIEYLEKKDEILKEKNDNDNSLIREVVNGISKLAKQTQKVSITNQKAGLTKTEVKQSFTEALNAVEKILINQNEVPSKTTYVRTNGRLDRIVETYSNYTLTTVFQRNVDGRILSETVTKK